MVELHRKEEEWCEKEVHCSGREEHEGSAPWMGHCSGEGRIRGTGAQSMAQDSGVARSEVGGAPRDWERNPCHQRV